MLSQNDLIKTIVDFTKLLVELHAARSVIERHNLTSEWKECVSNVRAQIKIEHEANPIGKISEKERRAGV
jgi:hypothetical protein